MCDAHCPTLFAHVPQLHSVPLGQATPGAPEHTLFVEPHVSQFAQGVVAPQAIDWQVNAVPKPVQLSGPTHCPIGVGSQ